MTTRPTCSLCLRREAEYRTRAGVKVCDPCRRDIARDTLHAPADFRPIQGGGR